MTLLTYVVYKAKKGPESLEWLFEILALMLAKIEN